MPRGPTDEDTATLAVQRGEQDYLLKHRFGNYLMPKALGHAIERTEIADAPFAENERARVTPNSIGDAIYAFVTDDVERSAVT
jgi:hypothetical protein